MAVMANGHGAGNSGTKPCLYRHFFEKFKLFGTISSYQAIPIKGGVTSCRLKDVV
jgi:hypothetical protein